jgi:lactoylglutathione lyase
MSDTRPAFAMMHTMIRVFDLDKSIKFYTELLGMTLLRRDDYPGGKFTNAFVGYGPEDTDTVVELTLNWGREEPYDLGTGFGHLALGVNDIYAVCAAARKAGRQASRARRARCCTARRTSPSSKIRMATRSS